MPFIQKKTLLFSIGVHECNKNFAAFPGALFDYLDKDLAQNGLRIVFVAPVEKPGLLDKARELKARHDESVEVEFISIKKRSWLQKCFTFFYSYFVYSGTTKTLATVGMRANDAPGGGSKWLAPLKWFISRTFGQIGFVRNVITNLYGFFYPDRPFKLIFDTYKPSLVFAPDLFDRFDQEFLRESIYQRVPSIGMVTNWDHFDKYFIPFKANHILAQSDQMMRFAERWQWYDRGAITVVGYPFLDFLMMKDYIETRETTLKNLGFADTSKYILYIAGSMYAPDEPDIIEKMIEWADNNELGGHDVRFVIRPYPGNRGRDQDFDQNKFEGFASHHRVSFQMERYWAGFETNAAFCNIMRHADVVMQVFSTAVLPAGALDRPLLTPTFDGYHVRPYERSVRRFMMREHFHDVIDTGGQQPAVSFEDLKRKIIAYLGNPGLDSEKRDALRERVIGPLDGKSSKRVHDAIISALNMS